MSALTATPAIQVAGLRKSYDGVAVLDDVDLVASPGTVTALLGPNGAGKTTLVRILATLLRADSGTVHVAGHDVATDPAAVRGAISLTGQFAAVDEVLTGRENLVLVARLRRVPDARGTAAEMLSRFDLEDAADRRVATYSGGMKRRLDLAMSLVGEPDVVVLDEPTTGLDPQARREVWACVRELVAAGATVLLTTQYLEEAEQLADRIVILDRGRVVVEGSLAELTALLPPARVEYVEKQPTLEDIFLAVVGQAAGAAGASTRKDT